MGDGKADLLSCKKQKLTLIEEPELRCKGVLSQTKDVSCTVFMTKNRSRNKVLIKILCLYDTSDRFFVYYHMEYRKVLL